MRTQDSRLAALEATVRPVTTAPAGTPFDYDAYADLLAAQRDKAPATLAAECADALAALPAWLAEQPPHLRDLGADWWQAFTLGCYGQAAG